MGRSVPSKVPLTTDPALGILGVVVDLFEKATGNRVFYCSKCGHRIILETGSAPPLVCRKCGEELDWDGLKKNDGLKKKVNVCPTCKRVYDDPEDEFCEDHTPAVKLQIDYR